MNTGNCHIKNFLPIYLVRVMPPPTCHGKKENMKIPMFGDFQFLRGCLMTSRVVLAASAALFLAVAGGQANAALLGADVIVVTNANNDWLQVGELIATQAGTGIDMALATRGAKALGVSTWSMVEDGGTTSLASYAIDGVYPVGYNYSINSAVPGIYHPSFTGPGASLTVTLAAPTDLSSITIWGRTDCCIERDVYNVAIYGAGGNLIDSINGLDARSGSGTVQFGNVSAVPLPAALPMFGAALVGLGGLARRRAKKAA